MIPTVENPAAKTENDRTIMNNMAILIVLCFIALGSGLSIAQDKSSKNELPKKQHRTSNAPFLKPAEAVKKMAIPDGFGSLNFCSRARYCRADRFLLRP